MTLTREQSVIAGPRREVSYFPIWPDGRRVPERAPKTKRSTKEQEKYNHDQAVKKFLLLVSANFSKGDLLLHLTFDDEHLPDTWEEVHRLITNYLNRVKYWRKKQGLPDMRYIYTVEMTVRKTGKRAGMINWHIHMFMSKMPRDQAEDMWPEGVRVNADRYNPDRFGDEAAAKYVAKELGSCGKRFAYSKNLKKPEKSKPRDGKITQRGLGKIIKERCEDAAYWEKKFPGYRFYGYEKPPEMCLNPFNGYWYLTVILYKTAAAKKER